MKKHESAVSRGNIFRHTYVCKEGSLTQLVFWAAAPGEGPNDADQGPSTGRWLVTRWPAGTPPSLAAPSMTGRCAGSAMRAAAKRICSLHVNVRGPWGQSIGAAWSTGCHPPIPATVSSATSGLQSSGSPGHWWRSVSGARPEILAVMSRWCLLVCPVTNPVELHRSTATGGVREREKDRSQEGQLTISLRSQLQLNLV